MTSKVLAGTALALMTAFPASAEGLVSKPSPYPVAETVDRLVTVVEGAGARVIARLDHQKNAASINAALRPTQVLIFGNPKLGTPVMQMAQTAGIDLPQRVVVLEDESGNVVLNYYSAEHLAALHGLDPTAPEIQKINAALGKLTDAALAP